MCEYKPIKCSACQLETPQKNWSEHQGQCQLTVKTCENCHIAYKPNDIHSQHSEIVCLREQFQQYRFAAQNEIGELRAELRQSQRNSYSFSFIKMLNIIFHFYFSRKSNRFVSITRSYSR